MICFFGGTFQVIWECQLKTLVSAGPRTEPEGHRCLISSRMY
jgi:hypothetical protein